ncbi:hypothetical protein EJ06DRAFT_532068 [Trichodelitschia bisporula]|uniref:Uncharacterized protein n=1 Tax=Trichodelitschia bisporula TaxID=703511 RepID=A0A6G1HQM6_9PEZI|nr:hypothetical protein EJ06DRAFT_532068 [Trichodelitschia bisporula]
MDKTQDYKELMREHTAKFLSNAARRAQARSDLETRHMQIISQSTTNKDSKQEDIQQRQQHVLDQAMSKLELSNPTSPKPTGLKVLQSAPPSPQSSRVLNKQGLRLIFDKQDSLEVAASR